MTPIPPRAIASPASRYILAAAGGGAVTTGAAVAARVRTERPDADGTSHGRIDRAEAREMFSGTSGMTTILPIIGALLCIPTLYTKGRILMAEKGTPPPAGLAQAAEALGASMRQGEAEGTKTIYATMGGAIVGSIAAGQTVFGDEPSYATRHVPITPH